jgi:hypothetical protein
MEQAEVATTAVGMGVVIGTGDGMAEIVEIAVTAVAVAVAIGIGAGGTVHRAIGGPEMQLLLVVEGGTGTIRQVLRRARNTSQASCRRGVCRPAAGAAAFAFLFHI